MTIGNVICDIEKVSRTFPREPVHFYVIVFLFMFSFILTSYVIQLATYKFGFWDTDKPLGNSLIETDYIYDASNRENLCLVKEVIF